MKGGGGQGEEPLGRRAGEEAPSSIPSFPAGADRLLQAWRWSLHTPRPVSPHSGSGLELELESLCGRCEAKAQGSPKVTCTQAVPGLQEPQSPEMPRRCAAPLQSAVWGGADESKE